MAEEQVTYYAITGRGKTVDDPHGIVRRRRSEGFVHDEVLNRDLQWRPTGIIAEWEYDSFDDELEEVGEEKAKQIIEAIRARRSN
ncbi:hypothetical protein Acsp04_47650 [Actinomadura sp. NBRC 104425]|uniref:hypothetical protein n=1 Tax=Actinomadura sp. NBRC 104425 TaxID=3032204 RepID=UPI0024A4D070|nr:hypothetical protein [Actinomadura sp. NBRC 104425]GLZ14530.1 hypothetical protein Acsp04_47650 [Actinomadura sp. NBRC 104425]